MHIYLILAHPSKKSFTRAVFDEFTRGLRDAGHTYEVSDLYAMDFKAILDKKAYTREVSMDPDAPLPPDVQAEHEKIEKADALAFVHPLWWGDCPARLKGWYDRVFTYGFAYTYEGPKFRPQLDQIKKALIVCTAGDSVKALEKNGIAPGMRHIMLDNRLRGVGIPEAELAILGGMASGSDEIREQNLAEAYRLGQTF